MYVVVSILNRMLGITQSCSTFDKAIETAIDITKQWSVLKLSDNFDVIRKSLESVHEYVITNANDGSEYAIYIGLLQ